jgi:hypothetical protein
MTEAKPSGAPDYFNRAAGVRIWRVAPTLWAQLGGLLWAPGMREPWPTTEREYVASCAAFPDHMPPAEGCVCGIYAFYTPQLAEEGIYWPQVAGPLYNRLVTGVVGVAGEVALHEYGLKAERATVEAIFTDGAPDDELPIPRHELAAAYDAVLIDSIDYEAFCAERGLIVFDPEDLD